MYTAGLVAFIREPHGAAKWAVIGVFVAVAAVFLLIGLALGRFERWRVKMGAVLVAGGAVAAFVALTIILFAMSEEFEALVPGHHLALFSDYVAGGAVIVTALLIGGVLWRMGATKSAPP